MPKLKNFLQDLGSAVVPAALTIGATALTGGAALAPMTLLAAGGAGARGFAANEEEERRRKQMKMQAEENRRAQSTANLINALQPGTGARARPAEIAAPKAGLGETVARGAATGIQAYTMAKQAQEAWQERERQRVLTEQQIATGKDEAEIRSGAQQAYEELSRRDEEEGGLVDLITRQRESFAEGPRRQIQTEAEAMSTLETSPETFSPRLFTTEPEDRSVKTADLIRPVEPWGSERGIPGAGPGFGTPSPQMQAAQDMMGGQPAPPPTGPAAVGYYEIMEADKKRRELEFEAAQKLDLDRRRVATLEARLGVDQTDAENNRTRLALLAAEKEVAEGLAREQRVQDTMRLLQGKIEGNPLYKKREANVRFIQDAIQGYASNNALGDLQLLKAVALMQDPTGTVKEQEFETMAGAAGELARLGINLNNYLTEAGGGAGGRRLNEASRNMFVQNAIVAYDNRSAATESDIALAVTREFIISGTPLEKLQQIGNSYHLPTGGSLFGDDEAGKALQGIYDEAKRETEGIYTGTGGLPELPSGDISEEELAELAKMTIDQRRVYGARLLGDAQDSDEEPSPDSGGARFGEVEPPSLSDTGDEEKVGFLKGLAPGLGLGGVTKDYWSKEKQREYDLIGQQWRGNLLGQIGEVGRYLGRGVLDPNRSLRRMRGGT